MIIKVFHLERGYTVITDIVEIKRIVLAKNEDKDLYDVTYCDLDGNMTEYNNCEVKSFDAFSTRIINKEKNVIIDLNENCIKYSDWEDDDEYYL